MSTAPDEPFRLEASPATVKATVVARIKAEHSRRDYVASRQPDAEAFAARAFYVMSALDLVECFDPAEGATAESVVAMLADRVEQAGRSRLRTARWWDRDLTVWQRGKLRATVTRARDGRKIVTWYE